MRAGIAGDLPRRPVRLPPAANPRRAADHDVPVSVWRGIVNAANRPRIRPPVAVARLQRLAARFSLGLTFLLAGPSAAVQVPEDSPGPYAVLREFNLRHQAKDGTTLVADVYRPVTPNRVPVILVRTPYLRTSASNGSAGAWWASHGYAFIVEDVRGRGDSDGTFEPLVHEADDGDASQTWAASLPWSNGRVGTLGGSYLGWTQVFPASRNNPALAAMIPSVTPSDPGGFWPMRRGGVVLGMLEWAILVEGRTNRGLPGEEADLLAAMKTPPLDSMDIRIGTRSSVWQSYLANLDNADFWKSRSYQADLVNSRVPMLHITGWYDGTLSGSFENFAAMRRAGREEQYLVIGPWRHWLDQDARAGKILGVDFGPESQVPMRQLSKAWFGRYLLGKTDALNGWDRVRLFVMGANRWIGGEDWPLAGTRFVPYHLESQGRLAENPRNGSGTDRYDYDPANPTPFLWSVDLDSGGPDDYRRVEARKDVLVYTSEPAQQQVVICGPVTANIVATSSARDTDWVVRLSVVRANGYSQRLTEGWVRARTRNGEFRNDSLTPGKQETYTIDLWGTCASVDPGERIRVAVMSAAFPLLAPNQNTGGSIASERTPVVAHQEIHYGPGRKSFVTLPVIDRPNWIRRP